MNTDKSEIIIGLLQESCYLMWERTFGGGRFHGGSLLGEIPPVGWKWVYSRLVKEGLLHLPLVGKTLDISMVNVKEN